MKLYSKLATTKKPWQQSAASSSRPHTLGSCDVLAPAVACVTTTSESCECSSREQRRGRVCLTNTWSTRLWTTRRCISPFLLSVSTVFKSVPHSDWNVERALNRRVWVSFLRELFTNHNEWHKSCSYGIRGCREIRYFYTLGLYLIICIFFK